MDLESSAVGAMLAASQHGEKLPWALILCGVLEAAAALWLLVYKVPGGIFLHHGEVVFYSYYGILVAVLLFGLAEAWVGFWLCCDVRDQRRRRIGKMVMWFSILPLVLVAGLGGGLAFVAPK